MLAFIRQWREGAAESEEKWWVRSRRAARIASEIEAQAAAAAARAAALARAEAGQIRLARAIQRQCALDRIMIGFNGTSVAAATGSASSTDIAMFIAT